MDSGKVVEAFVTLEMHVGTIVEALPFPEARKAAFRLRIDFGILGERWSSAQITDRYDHERLPGRQVIAVTNLPPKRIAGFVSEVLVLGVPDAAGAVVMLQPEAAVQNGVRVY